MMVTYPEVIRARFSVDRARSFIDWLRDEILVRFMFDYMEYRITCLFKHVS